MVNMYWNVFNDKLSIKLFCMYLFLKWLIWLDLGNELVFLKRLIWFKKWKKWNNWFYDLINIYLIFFLDVFKVEKGKINYLF